ncbi:MAG: hypothetical protein VXV86_06520, partial [Verrucomicrobiota bacterium]|nr:hypothetical protein [Verrucomicrobiota bacterium]
HSDCPSELALFSSVAAEAARTPIPLSAGMAHRRGFESLSSLLCAKSGSHYRSDPVRVQSTSCVDLTSTDMLLLQTTPAAWDDIWTACWPPRGREKPWTEIMLWATPKGPPRALQASECRELLNPTRASCLILAQRQPGKLPPRASTLS